MNARCRRLRLLGAVGVGLVLLATTGCSGPARGAPAAAAQPAVSTRPALKQTCPDVVWTPPTSLGIEQSSHQLVPFGPTILGVQSTWQGAGFSVETVAGGYVDDLTEPYDNLATTGKIPLQGDPQAEIMRGTLQSRRVLVVLWRDSSEQVPCDVHAFLVEGADAGTETLLLGGLR